MTAVSLCNAVTSGVEQEISDMTKELTEIQETMSLLKKVMMLRLRLLV